MLILSNNKNRFHNSRIAKKTPKTYADEGKNKSNLLFYTKSNGME